MKHFIDNGIGIWKHNTDPVQDAANWELFKSTVNDGGLEWEFTPLSNEINFMDMTINIVGNKIETNLFEKPLTLHLYIPPHSCHPKSGFGSLVSGMVLRIFRLCSESSDVSFSKVLPQLDKAINNATNYMLRNDTSLQHKSKKLSNRKLTFQLRYHPNDPPAHLIQKLARECLFHPTGKPRLNQLNNLEGGAIPLDGMVIAYSRSYNISNLLSYRKICNRPGPKVSSYL